MQEFFRLFCSHTQTRMKTTTSSLPFQCTELHRMTQSTQLMGLVLIRHDFSACFDFTCERELLCAATAPPPWCGPLSKPGEVAWGLARRLHSADGSLWWSPVIDDMYWLARTLNKTGVARKIRWWRHAIAFLCRAKGCYSVLSAKVRWL